MSDLFTKSYDGDKEVLSIRKSLTAGPFSSMVTTYEIVDKTYLRVPGFLGGSSRLTELAAIGDIKVEKTMLGRMTGVGNLVFFISGSSSDDRPRWDGVPDAERVRDFILRIKNSRFLSRDELEEKHGHKVPRSPHHVLSPSQRNIRDIVQWHDAYVETRESLLRRIADGHKYDPNRNEGHEYLLEGYEKNLAEQIERYKNVGGA